MACILIFFFKQKTAYEMRISDWSSDVCSSDLLPCGVAGRSIDPGQGASGCGQPPMVHDCRAGDAPQPAERAADHPGNAGTLSGRDTGQSTGAASHAFRWRAAGGRRHRLRSEEHTSELQSLMRISYAVLCLKKKK